MIILSQQTKQIIMATKISYMMACLLGIGMIFLGIRFFLAPELATAGFGMHYNAGGG
jgi:hypothetical protein